MDCRYHEDVKGTDLCTTCGARVCADCATKERQKDADSGKVCYTTHCPLCELDREIAKVGKPLDSLGTIAVILIIIPLLAFAVSEVVYEALAIDAANPGLFGYGTVAVVFLVLVTLPLLALRHEVRKYRERPVRLKALKEEREALLAKARTMD